jgi:hypothetical protein
MKKQISLLFCLPLLLFVLVGCAPEVGSEAWCKAMDEKPKGDWSSNEAASYAKHCILR